MNFRQILMAAATAPSGTAFTGDPYYANTTLLCHFDGGNGSTTFTDNSFQASTLTPVNSAAQSSAQAKFGPSSWPVPSAGVTAPYVTMPNTNMDFGTGDFTVEFWYYYDSVTYPAESFGIFFDNGSRGFAAEFGATAANTLIFVVAVGVKATGTHGMADGNWYHLAWVRNGSNNQIYVNGTSIASATDSTTTAPTGGTAYLGTLSTAPGTFSCGGFIDEMRITKGVARYTGNFTPPIAPFPNS